MTAVDAVPAVSVRLWRIMISAILSVELRGMMKSIWLVVAVYRVDGVVCEGDNSTLVRSEILYM